MSETILGLTFLDKSSVARVCRRSWNRMAGSPASSSSGAKYRSLRLVGSRAFSSPWQRQGPEPRKITETSHLLHLPCKVLLLPCKVLLLRPPTAVFVSCIVLRLRSVLGSLRSRCPL
jgi:hypothetical protein